RRSRRAGACGARAACGACGGGRPRLRTRVGGQGDSLPPRTIAPMAANPLRQLPSVDALLGLAGDTAERNGRAAPLAAIRSALAEARAAGEPRSPEQLLARVEQLLDRPASL